MSTTSHTLASAAPQQSRDTRRFSPSRAALALLVGAVLVSASASRASAQAQIVYVPSQTYVEPMMEPEDESRPNLGAIIPGAVLLGVGWVANLIVGLPAGDDPFVSGGAGDEWDAFRLSSIIPVAGPWVQLAVKPTDFDQDYWATWLIIDGLLQAAGLTVLIVGIATPSHSRGYAAVQGPTLALSPSASPGHAGLSLVGSF